MKHLLSSLWLTVLVAQFVVFMPEGLTWGVETVSAQREDTMNKKIIRSEAEWRRILTPEQYKVLREGGTECAFTGKYFNYHGNGTYVCAGCGQELFRSDNKFESGTGWPSFDQALPGAVKEIEDNTQGMRRTEAVCARCGSHLGHVFSDGPTKTGLRYCLNSVCLDLEEEKKM